MSLGGVLDTEVSVLLPFAPRRPEQVLPFAALTAWSNARRLWQGQSLLVEPYQAFTYAAGAGFRVPTGLGVTLMGLKTPYAAAVEARSLALATGHPVVAGFGPGAEPFQQAVRGSAYTSPLTASREYVTTVRELLDGGIVDRAGQYTTTHAQLSPLPMPRVEVGLGVLRPRMARLAGEVADRAITWLTPASYLREQVAPALRDGASLTGRPVPRVTAMVPVAVARHDRDATELALASNRAHLGAPHYRDMLRRAGVPLGEDVDLAADAAALVAADAFLSGSPEKIAELVAAYHDAGADEVVINVSGVYATYGQNAAVEELRTILREVVR